MTRAIILVADGLGIGAAPDAGKFNDVGCNTFFHIYQHMLNNGHVLNIPNLAKLGLVAACEQASGQKMPDLNSVKPEFAYGYMQEISTGKDTPSGHWEMAGSPVLFDWGYFFNKTNSFPQEVIDKLIAKTGVSGILGNKHAPGTDILVEFGQTHIETRQPICYTSVDSVFQVAAHEQHFGLENLYAFCEAAREILDEYNIGRVIARPFVGDSAADFKRTGNRRDFSVLPPSPTVLDKLAADGAEVISIGKISDIFAHQGVTKQVKANGLEALINKTIEEFESAPNHSLVFTNLVNFDQDYGHRRDIEGYAGALEYFDSRLPDVLATMAEDDYLFITADHGCDPSWVGTDHTREFVPILAAGRGVNDTNLGHRQTFADLAQTLCDLFSLQAGKYGDSFLNNLKTK